MTLHSSNQNPLNVLVLQGGGALGSYQAGVLEAVQELGGSPDWVAGISIGSINAALVAGNPPERRVERLRMFWERVTSNAAFPAYWRNDSARTALNKWSAAWGTVVGAPGFFSLRLPPRAFYPPDAPGPISYYDTSPLRDTLLELVDFNLINSKQTRFSVGTVDVATGNLRYFDNFEQPIVPEHVMASGALPPGFPPVEIDGAFYWDGGVVSNTPLQYVLDAAGHANLTILQVDLFPARGPLPTTLSDVSEREKDIRYSSRTRLNTDAQVDLHRLRSAFRRLEKKLPPELRNDEDAALLSLHARESSVSILQLIYRRQAYESGSKDYEFSRATMSEHWAGGVTDARRALSHPDWINRRRESEGVAVFDLSRDVQTPRTKD